MKKRIWFCLIALSLLLGGCGQAADVPEEQAFTAIGGEGVDQVEENTMTLSMRVPETLDPLWNREASVDRILKLVFLPLVDLDESGKPAPSVAESWETAADGRTVTVQLKSGLRWQNGTSLTAEDVVYSFRRLQSAPEDAVYKNALQYISGCTQAGTSAVTFTFYEGFSGNLNALCFPIVPSGMEITAETAIGNGPYRIESYTQASELLLAASDTYSGDRAQIARIRVKITAGEDTDINAFERGVTDVLIADATEAGRYADEDGMQMVQYTSNEYDFIGFSFDGIFQDKTLRHAVAYALPKESLLESVYLNYGVMTNTPLSPRSWLYEENVAPYNYDPEMAATILKNAGWADMNGDRCLDKTTDGRTESLRVTLLVNEENTARRQIAARLQEELTAIGFSVTIDRQPFAAYQEKLQTGQFDMVVGGWKCSEVTDLTPFFGTGGSLNYIGYSDESVDALLTAAHDAVGDGATLLAYSSLQKKLAEELPYISIAYRNEAVFTSKYVGGQIAPTAFHVYRGIEYWTYEKGE